MELKKLMDERAAAAARLTKAQSAVKSASAVEQESILEDMQSGHALYNEIVTRFGVPPALGVVNGNLAVIEGRTVYLDVAKRHASILPAYNV